MRSIIFAVVTIVLASFMVVKPAGAELLFHYNFESENLDDTSGNNNLGEIRGDAERIESVIGMGLKLDGVDDYLFTAGEGNATGPLVFMHTPFSERTVALWVKADDVNGNRVIVDEGGTGNGLAIRLNEGKLQFSVRSGSTEATILADYGDTDWHHIASVYKAGQIHLYVDGEKVGSGEAPFEQIGNHGDDSAIGATFDGDACGSTGRGAVPWNFFQGIMDEIYYYSNALTDEEISDLYNRVLAVTPGGKLTIRWAELKS